VSLLSLYSFLLCITRVGFACLGVFFFIFHFIVSDCMLACMRTMRCLEVHFFGGDGCDQKKKRDDGKKDVFLYIYPSSDKLPKTSVNLIDSIVCKKKKKINSTPFLFLFFCYVLHCDD